jgi:amino acid permease
MGTLHLITAVIGAGVLSLPQALAWLGWVVGIPLFVLFFCITM